MEVQISSAPQFNAIDQSVMRVPPTFQPLSKQFKSDLLFQCMFCDETFGDPSQRYEHMSSHHNDSYGNGYENDSDDEISEDLSRLLEPICEIRLIDDDANENDDKHKEPPNLNTVNHQPLIPAKLMESSDPVINEQLRLQIGLHIQMQLQQHLMQSRLNGMMQLQQQQPPLQPNQNQQMQQTNGNQGQPLPISIRKIEFTFQYTFPYLQHLLLDF